MKIQLEKLFSGVIILVLGIYFWALVSFGLISFLSYIDQYGRFKNSITLILLSTNILNWILNAVAIYIVYRARKAHNFLYITFRPKFSTIKLTLLVGFIFLSVTIFRLYINPPAGWKMNLFTWMTAWIFIAFCILSYPSVAILEKLIRDVIKKVFVLSWDHTILITLLVLINPLMQYRGGVVYEKYYSENGIYGSPCGVEVTTVVAQSPAQTVGLRKGDIILSVDNIDIVDTKQFMALISSSHQGQILTLKTKSKEYQVVPRIDAKLGVPMIGVQISNAECSKML